MVMALNKVTCIYNKNFFEQLYRLMIAVPADMVTDASNTVWHILDVEEILIKEYGYKRTSQGGIM